MNNIIIFIFSIHAAFIACVWAIYGVLPSISDSWYRLEKKNPLFTLYLWAIGLSIISVNFFTTDFNVFYFLSGVCLCFTGAAAEFKERITKTVHNIGAVGGIGLVFAGQVYVHVWIPAAVFAVVAVAIRLIKPVRNKTWWVENGAVPFALLGLIVEFNPTLIPWLLPHLK